MHQTRVVLCLCELCVRIICVDGRSMYLYIVLGSPSDQACCTLSISASYHVFLWQISQIQTCLCVVVGPGFVSTSPTFMRSSAGHLAGPHGRLAQIR